MPRCVAHRCNNNGNHKFPNCPQTRKLWEKATRLRNFKATDKSRLCAGHFRESDYQGLASTTGVPQVHRFLKKDAVPSIFSWSSSKDSSAPSLREQRYQKKTHAKELSKNKKTYNTVKVFLPSMDVNLEIPKSILPAVGSEVEVTTKTEPESESETESVDSHDQKEIVEKTTKTQSTQTPSILRLLSSEEMLSDDKSVLYYTGLESIDKFTLALSTLLPMANHITYRGNQTINMSTEDQFLLFLIKLRRNKDNFELSKLFGISIKEVRNVFVTWVNFVYELWSKIDLWTSRDLVDCYMPEYFKVFHPTTRVIVDTIEIPISNPKRLKSQYTAFSSNRDNKTVKFLVGVTPGGLICFCSQGYAGSTSNREIIEESTLIEKCDENDSIMADRSFNIQELLGQKNISLEYPTFFEGESQIPGISFKDDRIHIENINRLTKTYKILKRNFHPNYVPLLSRIFFICTMLCNFKENMVK